jgi:chromate reductase
MAYTPKILAFAGSLREGSYNKKLVKVAVKGAEAAGAQVTYVDLRDFELPIFDEDVEAKGEPAGARKLKDLMMAADGFLISAPEYNSSITAALKNAIDWASRPAKDEKPLAAFAGKVAVLMSASPGALGGLRGLVTVRSILGNIQVIVLPHQIAVSKAHEAFNEDGSMKDAKQQASIEGLGKQLAEFVAKLKG